jgi:hypothetical protein
MIKLKDNWIVRFSNDGIGYGGFVWNPVGEWTTAPDWNSKPECGGGLHGQGVGGWGYCSGGTRFELAQTRGKRVVIEGEKIKVKSAKIVLIDKEAFEFVVNLFDGHFPGSLDLREYKYPLPENLTSIGGYAYLRGYDHPLAAKILNYGENK